MSRLSDILANTEKRGDCLLWKGTDGYPALDVQGPYREVFKLTHGIELTSEQHVCHSCDTPACVNVDHLWLGDVKLNAVDSKLKGRRVGRSYTKSLPPYYMFVLATFEKELALHDARVSA